MRFILQERVAIIHCSDLPSASYPCKMAQYHKILISQPYQNISIFCASLLASLVAKLSRLFPFPFRLWWGWGWQIHVCGDAAATGQWMNAEWEEEAFATRLSLWLRGELKPKIMSYELSLYSMNQWGRYHILSNAERWSPNLQQDLVVDVMWWLHSRNQDFPFAIHLADKTAIESWD